MDKAKSNTLGNTKGYPGAPDRVGENRDPCVYHRPNEPYRSETGEAQEVGERKKIPKRLRVTRQLLRLLKSKVCETPDQNRDPCVSHRSNEQYLSGTQRYKRLEKGRNPEKTESDKRIIREQGVRDPRLEIEIHASPTDPTNHT